MTEWIFTWNYSFGKQGPWLQSLGWWYCAEEARAIWWNWGWRDLEQMEWTSWTPGQYLDSDLFMGSWLGWGMIPIRREMAGVQGEGRVTDGKLGSFTAHWRSLRSFSGAGLSGGSLMGSRWGYSEQSNPPKHTSSTRKFWYQNNPGFHRLAPLMHLPFSDFPKAYLRPIKTLLFRPVERPEVFRMHFNKKKSKGFSDSSSVLFGHIFKARSMKNYAIALELFPLFLPAALNICCIVLLKHEFPRVITKKKKK